MAVRRGRSADPDVGDSKRAQRFPFLEFPSDLNASQRETRRDPPSGLRAYDKRRPRFARDGARSPDSSVSAGAGRRLSLSLVLDAAEFATLHLDRVAAELIAQRGDYLGGERVVLARNETREQREGDDRSGDVFVYRRLNCPAALAGVLYV